MGRRTKDNAFLKHYLKGIWPPIICDDHAIFTNSMGRDARRPRETWRDQCVACRNAALHRCDSGCLAATGWSAGEGAWV